MQASSSGNYIAEEAFKNSFVQQSHWTLKTPIQIIFDHLGDIKQENVWERIRETEGDYFDSWLKRVNLVALMLFVANTWKFPKVEDFNEFLKELKLGRGLNTFDLLNKFQLEDVSSVNIEKAGLWFHYTYTIGSVFDFWAEYITHNHENNIFIGDQDEANQEG